MTLCANTAYLNAYLRDQDAAEIRQDWIEKEAAHMLRAMQPWSRNSVDEALSETTCDLKRCTAIVAAMNGTDDAELGRVIRAAVSAYWMDYCMSEAAEAYDSGAAQEQPEE